MSEPRRSPSQTARGFGLLVTNLIRLGGLVLAMNEGLFHSSDPKLPVVLAICVFMMAGANGLESLLSRLFGGSPP